MKRVWKQVLFLAFLYALLVLIAFVDSEVWVDRVAIGLIAGVAYAGAMVIPMRLHLLTTEREGPGCVAFAAMIFLGLGGAILTLVGLSWLQFPRGAWEEIPPPPERVIEIIDSSRFVMSGREVWVRSETNRLYSLECGGGMSCEWEAQASLPEANSAQNDFCNEPTTPRYMPPFRWEQPIDRRSDFYCGADYNLETHYWLMEDGSLWTWPHFAGMWDLGRYFLIVGGGVFLAMGASLVYGAMRRREMGKMRQNL
jgi:hypothetical protein